MNQTIAISDFVKRQTPESSFSHFSGTWDELLSRVRVNMHNAQPGYRDGVLRVPVPALGFWSAVVTLEEGDKIEGGFIRRAPGEEPRKSTFVRGDKQLAKCVDVILYRRDVLAETNEVSTDADWEVITFLARVTEDPAPMDPNTLMANHFQISGGTATNMDDAQFVVALRESFMYWRDKAQCKPRNTTNKELSDVANPADTV